ncbi:MAG: hypothetical protein ACR2QE_04015 [Acidimicrobiales bacterium]
MSERKPLVIVIVLVALLVAAGAVFLLVADDQSAPSTGAPAVDAAADPELDDLELDEIELEHFEGDLIPEQSFSDMRSDVGIDDDEFDPDFEGQDIPDPEEIFGPGLKKLCVSVEHAEVPEQNAASGIWVRGEVYGLDGGWIWVEGPSLNNGDPIGIEVIDGAFDAPLGINSYGDHAIESFDLFASADEVDAAADLLDSLVLGPGTVLPVGPDEGPVFDQECFDFDPPTPAATTGRGGPAELVPAFLDSFEAAHAADDVEWLLGHLHPAVPDAFGSATCDDYVEATAGSITAVELVDVGPPGPFDLAGPQGPIDFDQAVPFTAVFTTFEGDDITNAGHLPVLDGELTYLTTCGADVP